MNIIKAHVVGCIVVKLPDVIVEGCSYLGWEGFVVCTSVCGETRGVKGRPLGTRDAGKELRPALAGGLKLSSCGSWLPYKSPVPLRWSCKQNSGDSLGNVDGRLLFCLTQ